MAIKRGTHCKELNYLVTFLNLKLTQKDGDSIFADTSKYGPSAHAKRFINAHSLAGTLSELLAAQRDISHLLRCLQPEVYEAIPPNPGDAQRRAMIHSFSAIQPAEADAANLNFQGKWQLKKYPVGGRGQIFEWIAKILDQAELSNLRCCRVCRRFFVPIRRKHKYCRAQACKRFYDKRMKRSRNAKLSAEKAIEQQQKGIPRFKELTVSSDEHIRDVFGEQLDVFWPFKDRVKQGEPPEQLWRELPLWMKKFLSGNSNHLRPIGRPSGHSFTLTPNSLTPVKLHVNQNAPMVKLKSSYPDVLTVTQAAARRRRFSAAKFIF